MNNNLFIFIDVWFVRIRQYLAKKQLFENLRVPKIKKIAFKVFQSTKHCITQKNKFFDILMV